MRVQTQVDSKDYTGIIDTTKLKNYLRFDGTDQDDVLPTLIEGAIQLCEQYCNRSFGSKTITAQFLDLEPYTRAKLPFGFVRSINSVNRVNQDGTLTLLTVGDDYYIEGLTQKSVVIKNPSYSTNDNTCNYQVEYTAGPASPSTETDEAVILAIYKTIADAFENREDSISGVSIDKLPLEAKQFLANYRLM